MSAGLAALAKVLTTLVNDKPIDKDLFIKQLSDAGRLIADAHHSTSINRRSFISPSLSNTMKAVGEKSVIDEWLHGTELGPSIEKAQKIEKQSKSLKIQNPPSNNENKSKKYQASRNNNNNNNNKPSSNDYYYHDNLNSRRPFRGYHRQNAQRQYDRRQHQNGHQKKKRSPKRR